MTSPPSRRARSSGSEREGHAGTGRGGSPRYLLVTRAGCHLCDDMADLLDQVLPGRGLGYETIDVDGGGAAADVLRDRFGDVVPVLLRDGVAVAKVRLDRAGLERILDRKR